MVGRDKTISELKTHQPDYGNWVSMKLLSIPCAVGILLAGLSLFLSVIAILAVIFFLSFAYFAYARYRFSPGGGNIQARIQGLAVENLKLDNEGKVIDIGCGSGAVTIMIAKKYPGARVTGVDYWGGTWEYSKSVCERNAETEGVAERVLFQKASASALPFDDESFDAVISNLTFHEVNDVRDKRDVIKEALRVLRKRGCFVFQDLFLWQRIYGELGDLLNTIRSWGLESVEFVNTSDSDFIPKSLKLPFMVGTMGILHGRK